MRRKCQILLLLPLVCSCQHAAPSPPAQGGAQEGGRAEQHLHPYLRQKLHEIEGAVRRANLLHGDYEAQEDSLDIRVTNINKDELSRYVRAPAAVLRVFGAAYALVDDNVLALHDHGGQVIVEFLTVFPGIEGFLTAQFTLMAENTLILFLFEDHLELYSSPSIGNWSTLVHSQSITNERMQPIAAEFVHCLGRLYLAVAYADRFGGTVNSLVYEWTGSHLDEVYELPTAGAVDLAVVLQTTHFYVAVAERPPRQSKHCVTIYKITPGSTLRRHRIPSASPRRLLAYEEFHDQEEEVFLLILDTDGKGTVLKLEGDEFLQHHVMDLGSSPTASTVGYLEAVPVLLTAHGNNINLSKVSHSRLVPQISLPTEGTSVSMLELMEVEYGKYRIIVASSTDTRLVVQIVSLAVRRNIIIQPPAPNPLEACVQQVTNELNSRQEAIDQLSLKLHQLDTSEDVIYDSELTLDHEVKLSFSKLGRLVVNTDTPLHYSEDEIRETGQAVLDGVRDLDEKLKNLVYKDKPVLIDFPVVLEGDLKANKLEAEFIKAKHVNGDEFNRDHFVWDDKEIKIDVEDQHVIEELHVVNLTAPNIFIEGFLANPTVKNLKVNNILIPPDQTVNGIYLDQVVLKNKQTVIEGNKIFEDVVADTVYAETLGEVNMEELLLQPPQVKRITTSENVIVEDLIVETVNNMNIAQFMEDVFIRDFDTTIEGDITFNKLIEVNELETKTFQGILVEEMLTKTTDQVITANVTFDTLNFQEGRFGLINGLDIVKDVAFVGKHNIIQSPVNIGKLNIKGNLILNCGKHQHHYCNLLGVVPEDKMQIYDAPVYIDGSLTVNDVKFSKDATVMVGDQYFHTDFEKLFWMKSKRQRIPDGVKFRAGLTVPHIEATVMNGIPLENFASIHSDFTDIPVFIDELYLSGDLTVQPGTGCAALADLGRDVVTRDGDFIITGNKIFTGAVEVEHLRATAIDGVDLNDIALLDDPREKTFYGDVSVKNVEVKGDLRAYCDVEARLVNGYPLRRVAERALRVDRDAYLEAVTFAKSLQGVNILVENGPLAEAVKNIDRLFEGINVTVAGELKLTNGVNQVKYLNGIDFESYIGQVVDKDIGGLVAGKKVFDKGLQVATALEAKTINGIDFWNIIKKAVRKQGVQKITGTHRIEHLYANQLSTKYLNNLEVDNLVDASKPIILNSSLIFENVNVFGTLNAKSPIDLKNYKESITKINSQCWDEVNIDGGIDWAIPGVVSNIVEFAVHGFHENIITGNVTFGAPVQTNHLMTNVYIDDVDIQFIAKDAILKSTPDQEIFGKKIFVGPTEINKLYVDGEFFSQNISSFDLPYINETMARKYKDNNFQGHVIFNGNVTTDYIKANSISGIPDLKDIITVDTIQSIRNIDASRVHVTGDLFLNKINGLNFTNFIRSIVLTEGETQYVYGDVEFQELQIDDLTTTTINGVNVDDIVFDDPETEINIRGDITFKGDVNMNGNVIVDVLNSININEAYEKTWWSNEDTVISGNLNMKGMPVFEGGLYGKINEVNIKNEIYKAIRYIDENIDLSIAALAEVDKTLTETRTSYEDISPEFLYLELVKSTDLKVVDDRSSRSTASCRANNCTVVIHSTNLDCLRAGLCACSLRRLINIDTSNWIISSTNEALNIRSFIVTDRKDIEVATIEVIMTKNIDYGCRTQIILKWMSLDYQITDNIVEIADEIKGLIVDVKSVAINDQILITIGVDSGLNIIDESIIIVLDSEEHVIVLRGSVETCGATHVVASVAGGSVHLLFANSDSCDRVANLAYEYEVEKQQIAPIEADVSTSYQLAAATTKENERIVVLAAFSEGKSELKELVYNIEDSRYETRQRIKFDSHPVVGLELVNIYGTRQYQTLLCVASSDGFITVYTRQHFKGWQIKSSGRVEGATGLLHLKGSGWPFILVMSSNSSAVLSLTSAGL